jgi:mannose-1-phosphate guanylyltransferase
MPLVDRTLVARESLCCSAHPAAESTFQQEEEMQRGETLEDAHDDSFVIILAGGEGRRLHGYTTRRDGVAVPKQFCRFREGRTLLGATIDRALQITAPERVVVVVVEPHRSWWEPDVTQLPDENVIAQPENRGTALAILAALVEVHRRQTLPSIVVMPSDSDVEDEPVLMRSILRAQQATTIFPNEVVLLGIEPTHLDCEYGLIVPTLERLGASHGVRAFIEKPALNLAAELSRHGALWNSFIFACEGAVLYDRFEATLPTLARSYLRGLVLARGDAEATRVLYHHLPSHDFSRDVLEPSAGHLRVIGVPPCGWTDIGTPARLAAWLGRHRDAPYWRDHDVSRLKHGDGIPDATWAG